jgi:hypothetical protein
MAKHLMTSAPASNAGNWRLSDEANVTELREQVRNAMVEGEILQITVLINIAPPIMGELLLNGILLEQAAVVDI